MERRDAEESEKINDSITSEIQMTSSIEPPHFIDNRLNWKGGVSLKQKGKSYAGE
jgi:hypothetical protein